MRLLKSLFFLVLIIAHLGSYAQMPAAFKPKKRHSSRDLVITQISENAFVHTTYLQTNDFGRVPCNGLVVRDGGEALIFDTPTTDSESEALIRWVEKKLHCKVKAVVPTHFHNDCLGGLNAFTARGIASYASEKTITLATKNNFPVPANGFRDSLVLAVGNAQVRLTFFGEGHTADNVVAYFPSEKVLFGGCLVKEIGASKGFLGDANLATWTATVENVKKAYPEVQVVVPGHGNPGGAQLLDYTAELFRVK